MADLFDWSAVESSNTSIGGYNSNTGMSPANVDNIFRAIVSIIRNSFASTLKTFLAGTVPLPIANGGTAATDAATALSNLGALASTYRDLPPVFKSAGFNIDNSERSYAIIYSGSAGAATIRPQSSHAVNTVAVYVIYNNGSGSLTFTRGSGVILRANGVVASADASLAVGGEAVLKYYGSDTWTISGSGLS